jgi:hypothetical protein
MLGLKSFSLGIKRKQAVIVLSTPLEDLSSGAVFGAFNGPRMAKWMFLGVWAI